MKAPLSENVLIVSYTIVPKEFIDGKALSDNPKYSLDVWQKSASWYVISHANLSPAP